MEVPLCYIPGNVTRVKVKVVGDMLLEGSDQDCTIWSGPPTLIGHTESAGKFVVYGLYSVLFVYSDIEEDPVK